jgi:hypothetical protein
VLQICSQLLSEYMSLHNHGERVRNLLHIQRLEIDMWERLALERSAGAGEVELLFAIA